MQKTINILLYQFIIITSNAAIAGQTSLETMVVTGTRSDHDTWDTPIPTDSIAIEDARKRGKQTLADVLAEQPGVEIIPAIRGQTIRLQGFDSKYVLILVNGQRMTGKVGETFDLNSISLDQIERVEVVRGAASSLYGSDAIAGVVNVILRRPLHDSQDLRLRWGTDKAIAIGAQLGLIGENRDQSINISASKMEPWRRTSSPATTLSGTQDTDINWQYNQSVTHSFLWKTRLGYQINNLKGTDMSAAGAVWDRQNLTSRKTLQLGPELRFDNGSLLKLDSQFQDYEDIYKTELRVRTSVHTKEVTEERLQEHTLTYQHELMQQHSLTWGLTAIDEYLESDRLKTDHVQRSRNSLFIQDEWTLESIRDLSLVPGVRLDDDSQFGEHTSGKLALRYAFTPNTIIRPSYGEGFRAPAFKELYLRFENAAVGYDVIGYEGLKPESSKSAQMALDHRFSLQQSISANLYQNQIKDLISTTTLPDQGDGLLHFSYRNVAEARNRGADVSYKWSGLTLDLMLTWQFLDARDVENDRPLENRAKHSIAWQINRWNVTEQLQLHFSSRWTGPQTIYDENYEPTLSRPTHIESAGALYQWTAALSSGITIENLANSWEDRILQVRPRTYIVSLNWNHQNLRKDRP